MRKPYSRDLNRLLDLELERNERYGQSSPPIRN